MRDIPDWELQSWESATKYGKKVVVELREPFKEPIIKKNIDFFEAMRLTKGFTLLHSKESAHKITFEYDKKDDTQDYLDELKKESRKIIRDLELRRMGYKLDKRVSELEYLKDNDEVKIVIDGKELMNCFIKYDKNGIIIHYGGDR